MFFSLGFKAIGFTFLGDLKICLETKHQQVSDGW